MSSSFTRSLRFAVPSVDLAHLSSTTSATTTAPVIGLRRARTSDMRTRGSALSTDSTSSG